MSSTPVNWQQILGLATQAAPTNSANTQNGLPSGAAATPGLTTGLPIQSAINPNAVVPGQASQNISAATAGADAVQQQIRRAQAASTAQGALKQQQNAAAAIPNPDVGPDTSQNPSAAIPGLAQQPQLACGGMVERKALGGPMQGPFGTAPQPMPAQLVAPAQPAMPVGMPAVGGPPGMRPRMPGQGGPPMAQPSMASGGAVAPAYPMQALPANAQPTTGGVTGMAGGGMMKGLGSGMKIHPIAKIHVEAIHPIRMTNPLHTLSGGGSCMAEGGSMEEGRTDHIDPGTAEFETHAMGGEVDHYSDGARHLRHVHQLLPKSAQKHIESAHKATLDEMHNAAFGKGHGSVAASPTDPAPAPGPGMGTESSEESPSAPQETTSGAPEFKKGGEVSKAKEHKADKKEEEKKKRDHKAAGGAIRGKAGEESDSKAMAPKAAYARGGYVDPGTTEFSCGTANGKGPVKEARGMGMAKRGGDFSYKHGGKVKK